MEPEKQLEVVLVVADGTVRLPRRFVRAPLPETLEGVDGKRYRLGRGNHRRFAFYHEDTDTLLRDDAEQRLLRLMRAD
jgi:hypothetical protein